MLLIVSAGMVLFAGRIPAEFIACAHEKDRARGPHPAHAVRPASPARIDAIALKFIDAFFGFNVSKPCAGPENQEYESVRFAYFAGVKSKFTD